MKAFIGIFSGTGLALALMAFVSCSSMQRGPNGGAVVSLKDSHAKAEILANAESGMIMVYTWDRALKKSQPISYKPLMISSGDQTVDLQPYPTADDSAGYSSRFFGKADWLREGEMKFGWLGGGIEQIKYNFNWNKSLSAGKTRDSLFNKMDNHQGGMVGDGTGDMMKNDSGTEVDNVISSRMGHQ